MKLGASGIGVMYPGKLSDLTGIPYPEIDAGLVELEVTQWIKRDRNVIWIRNALRCDPYINLQNRNHVVPIMRHMAGLPKTKLIGEFCAYYGLDEEWVENGVPTDFPDHGIPDSAGEPIPDRTAVTDPGSGEKEIRREGDKEITPKRARAAGWRFCPDDWMPNEKHFALAAEFGVNLSVEESKFRDHEFKNPKTDADRAFSRWLRQAKEFGNPLGKRGNPTERVQAGVQSMAEYLREKGLAS